jgi:hypothetical protein
LPNTRESKYQVPNKSHSDVFIVPNLGMHVCKSS